MAILQYKVKSLNDKKKKKNKKERKRLGLLSRVSRPSWFERCVPSLHPPATLQDAQQPLRDGSFLGPSLYGGKQLAIGHKNLYFQKSSKRSLCSGHDVLGFFFPFWRANSVVANLQRAIRVSGSVMS